MDRVVRLTDSGARPTTARSGGRPRRQGAVRRRRSKTALVLGGGGLTGAVYEIGALRALDLLAVHRSVNEFDVYVGTSAGSFVAAAVANGVTPGEMMRAIVRDGPTSFPDVRAGSLLRPNYREFVTRGVKLPLRLATLAVELARHLGQVSAVDAVLALAEALPTGLYAGAGLEQYVREILAEPSRTDDFRELESELYIVATDLDTCERAVFGAPGLDEVPISRAVSASSALPMVYRPVEIGGHEFVDGGLVSTTNLDVAVEAGARFVVVVNPLVPYVNDADITAPEGRRRRVSAMGFPQIGYQAFKLLAHQRLHELAHRWEERYPGVDIILIEPEATDELMFRTNVMNFSSRVEIARHGFESVTMHLSHEYPRYKEICARHGIEISAARVRNVVRRFDTDHASTGAWRKILEQTTATLLRQSAS